MDSRTMKQREFYLSKMTDHEFAQFIKKQELTYSAHLIGNVYSDKSGNSVAVAVFDNSKMTRDIWVKNGIAEFRFSK